MTFFVAFMFGCLFFTFHQAVIAKDIFQNEAQSSGAICKKNEDCDASEICLTKLPDHRYLQPVQTQAEHSSLAKKNVDEYGYREIPWYGFPYDSDAKKDIKSLNATKRQATKGPATSVHLNYYQNTLGHRDFEKIKKKGWVVKNKIKVEKTAPSTYFALLQFPGAYAGIQELKSEHCSGGICGLAIFSMWNDGSNDVAVIDQGDGVDVSPFGGEGTGQRSKKFLKWKPGEVIEFKIKGTYKRRINGWRLNGSFVWKGKRYQMATFERPGDRNILNNFGFSSFVEDFDRGVDVNGCQHKRSAEFLNPTIEYKDSKGQSKTITFTKARFTKDQSTRPQDRYCKDWTCARSGTTRGSFYLETGGKGSVTSQSCRNNMEVTAGNKKRSMVNVNSVTVLDTMKFCIAKE